MQEAALGCLITSIDQSLKAQLTPLAWGVMFWV